MQKKIESILWSIALPGFSQMLNGRLFKGTVFIILEVLINVQANLNLVIIPSFHWDMETAIQLTNYQWLMFYPCLYVFAMWDAYRDVSDNSVSSYLFIPFVSAAICSTVGVIYSSTFRLFGYLIGPIFLPIAFLLIGFVLGAIIKYYVVKKHNKK